MKQKKKRYNRVEDLLKDLEQPIDFLAYHFNIPGYTKEDLKQELYLAILTIWKKEKVKNKKLGFWFIRCKWHLLNMITQSDRKPLDSAISLEKFLRENNEG
jgi:hypothetical protein